ncbi:MAG: hypothetical protein PHS57_04475 [Alphaproteobacteria bacterium]|nr:hypothetical protein [Alphaproteobacteria bacterium]
MPLSKEALYAVRQSVIPDWKPSGLWVGFDGSWREGAGKRIRQTFGQSAYNNFLYDLDIDKKKILVLDGADERRLKAFFDTFAVEAYGRSAVFWSRVEAIYHGVALVNFQDDFHTGLRSFFYGWDCDSACLWNPDAIQAVWPSDPTEEFSNKAAFDFASRQTAFAVPKRKADRVDHYNRAHFGKAVLEDDVLASLVSDLEDDVRTALDKSHPQKLQAAFDAAAHIVIGSPQWAFDGVTFFLDALHDPRAESLFNRSEDAEAFRAFEAVKRFFSSASLVEPLLLSDRNPYAFNALAFRRGAFDDTLERLRRAIASYAPFKQNIPNVSTARTRSSSDPVLR